MKKIDKINRLLLEYDKSADNSYSNGDGKKIIAPLVLFVCAILMTFVDNALQTALALYLCVLSNFYLFTLYRVKRSYNSLFISVVNNPALIIVLAIILFVFYLVYIAIFAKFLISIGIEPTSFIRFNIVFMPLIVLQLFFLFAEYRDYKKASVFKNNLDNIKKEIKASLNTIHGMLYCQNYCQERKLKHSESIVNNLIEKKIRQSGYKSLLDYHRSMYENEHIMNSNNNKNTIKNL